MMWLASWRGRPRAHTRPAASAPRAGPSGSTHSPRRGRGAGLAGNARRPQQGSARESTRRALCRSECVRPCSWMKRSDAPCRSAWKPAQLCSQPWSSARPSTGEGYVDACIGGDQATTGRRRCGARVKKTAFGSRGEMRALSKLIKAFSSAILLGSAPHSRRASQCCRSAAAPSSARRLRGGRRVRALPLPKIPW